MAQFIGLAIAFVLLPVEIKLYPKIFKKKASLGPILMLTGVIMAVIGGVGPAGMWKALKGVFTSFSSLQTLIVVVEIGVLGSIMKEYGILEKIVSALERLIPSKKGLVMMLPAIMGTLPVPGGAFLSAPFVDSVGSDLGMDGANKAAVNLYFRHFAMFILPYNTTLLTIVSILPQINVYNIIGLNLGFVAVMLIGAYLAYVRRLPAAPSKGENKGGAIRDILVYLSPIYMAVVFNTVCGLKMYQSIFLCILLTFFLVGKDKSRYLPSIVRGINLDTVIMLVGVYFMQNVIKSLDAVMSGVGGVLSGQSVIGFMVIVPVVGLAFGLSTGMSLVPMGILLPFVAGMGLEGAALPVYSFYVLVWSFLGYYYSPFHLCQLLTVQYMGCETGEVYRMHLRMAPVLAIAAVALFGLYYTLLI